MSSISEPFISVRHSIRWLPDAASEPTSTLVLTSSSKLFVDIRIFKPTQPGEPELPNEGGPMTRLEWGFAGTATSSLVPPNEPNGIPTTHSTWTHWVDSNSDEPGTDEGDMFPQADGTILEIGNMVNPATGKATDYEEVWSDLPAEAMGDADVKARWSIVLDLDDEAHGVRGRIVRIGQWCQGIIKAQGEVCCERWQWVEETEAAETKGSWKRVARLGRLFLPCSVAFKPEELVEGAKVSYGDYKWEVKEVFSW